MKSRPLVIMACVFLGTVLMTQYSLLIIIPMAGLILYSLNTYLKAKGRLYAAVFACIYIFLILIAGHHVSYLNNIREAENNYIKENSICLVSGRISHKDEKNDQYLYKLTDCYIVEKSSRIKAFDTLVYLDSNEYFIGESILVKGQADAFENAGNEGGFDMKAFYNSKMIDICFYSPNIVKSDRNKDAVADFIYNIRCMMRAVYEDCLSKEHAGVMSVMLLGDKSILNEEVKSLYQTTGISHILAISGLHVSLIGLSLYGFFRRRGVDFFFSFVWSLPILLLYTTMTGNGISTKRATGMLIISMLANVFGRAYDSLNSLGLIAMLLLWENPYAITYGGFQFSVVAIIGVGFIGNSIKLMEKKSGRPTFLEIRKNNLLVAVAIFLTTLPLVAYNYYVIPLYAVLLNIIILPLLQVVFIFGLMGAGVGLLSLDIAGIILMPADFILALYDYLAAISMKLPNASYITGRPSLIRMCIYYLLITGSALIWRKYKRSQKLRIASIVLLFIVMIIPSIKTFELDALDVGQGDAFYIRSHEGYNLFVDAGSTSESDIGKYIILPFLKSKGVMHIDYWFVSHGDKDHISGLLEAIDNDYRIENIVMAKAMYKSDLLTELICKAKEKKINIISLKQGDRINLPGKRTSTSINILDPDIGGTFTDSNELSLVFWYDSETFAGLFAGDISSDTEKSIIDDGRLFELVSGARKRKATIFLKGIHHGSRYSNSKELLEIIRPDIAIISCAIKNNYGHPSKEAISNIESTGCEILYTMKYGQCQIRPHGQGYCYCLPKSYMIE